MPRDFREALKHADEALAEQGMSREADRRLRERLGLSGATHRFSWRPLAVGALAAACAVLVVALINAPRHEPQMGGFVLREASSDFDAVSSPDRTVSIKSGKVTLVDAEQGVSLASLGQGSVRKERGGVRVVKGEFETAVVRRAQGEAPCRVFVSHGAIEVLGTRFTVRQRDDGGTVTLHEGKIRFVNQDDGRVVSLAPGESLTWPLPPPGAPVEMPQIEPPRPEEPTPPPAVKPLPIPARPVPEPVKPVVEPEAARIEDLLQRIDEMRGRGQYDAAAAELSKALSAAGWGEATRERLSFELGIIWSRPGSDGERACGHWRTHEKAFPRGRYDREIGQAVKRLGCPEP